MSATPRPGRDSSPFSLDAEDEADERLHRRLHAPKPAHLVEVAPRGRRDVIADAAAEQAVKLLTGGTLRTVGVVVNRVARARAIADALRERTSDVDVLLLLGPSRPFERDRAVQDALPRIGAGRTRSSDDRPLVVVATQTIEVGADLDFDGLVTECAPADSLRQRFGRLDRLGDLEGRARAVVLYAPTTDEDPVYGAAVEPAWRWLQDQATEGVVDVSPRALREPPTEALAPRAQSPLLFPAYLDRLVQTSPLPTPDPEVALFLHGFDSRPPDVEIVWRADLDPERTTHWRDVVALAPPSGLEAVRVSFAAVRRWLGGLAPAEIADVEGGAEERIEEESSVAALKALRWRGPRADETRPISASELRPGDTIVVPAGYGGCDGDGWAPSSPAPVIDLVEGIALEQGRPVLRLHPLTLAHAGVDPALAGELLVPDEDDPDVLVPDDEAVSRALVALAESSSTLGTAARVLRDRHEVLVYPDRGGVFVSAVDDVPTLDDSEGELAGARTAILLRHHQEGVSKEVARSVEAVDLAGLGSALEAAAARHDEGKRDPRFQRLLTGSPIPLDQPIAKGRVRVRDRGAQRRAWLASGLPNGFRHEAVSVALLDDIDDDLDADLVRHLVASHHGCARPYLPAVEDGSPWVDVSEQQRVDGQTPERFWRLVRRYGWWGLAYLETILRLADHRQSASERP